MANIVPLSRTPRRLIHVNKTMANKASGMLYGRNKGTADVMARIPADTETETVKI